MDIDSPPVPHDTSSSSHPHLSLPPFSASFPLPFRVLFLVGLAQFLWATNLHVLHLVGIDTAWILDIRDPESSVEPLPPEPERLELTALGLPPVTPPPRINGTAVPPSRPSSLHAPMYRMFGLYSLWVGGGWALFQWITGGEAEAMERWRALIGVIAVGPLLAALLPWRGVGDRERRAMRRAIRRIVWPLSASIFFADILFADILTSFAKVMGDLWVSATQIWNGGITQGRVAQTGWSNWIVIGMVALPYALRLRQCLLEYWHSGSTRPLANALKYASAFPVIFLSAAQKSLLMDIASEKGITIDQLHEGRWFGEHRVFRLWLLAVVANSMFSFYWDVGMDWGLALCEIDTWLPNRARRDELAGGVGLLGSPARLGKEPQSRRASDPSHSIWTRAKYLFSKPASSHQRSPCPTPNPYSLDSPRGSPRLRAITTPFAFGLRPVLLLPDPIVYHIFALIDLVLRFTWSLKLSSHLHTISEIESGVFMMEALELVRRWMWVLVRIEWEIVKMSGAEAPRATPVAPGAARRQVVWDADEKEGD